MTYKYDASVIMTVFNHEKFLYQALSSIANQNFIGNVEVLIGEDCSSDDSKKIILDFITNLENSKIEFKPFFKSKNLNIFNYIDLIQRAKGKYVFHLEGDDFWVTNNKLKKQINFMEKNPTIFACGHRHYIFDNKNNTFRVNTELFNEDRLIRPSEALKFQSSLMHPSSFCYRNLFEKSLHSFLTYSNRYGSHSTLINVFANKSNIYIFQEPMSAWRRVVDQTASNYTSFASFNSYKVSENNFFKLLNFENFFGIKPEYRRLVRMAFGEHILELFKSKTSNKFFRLRLYLKYFGTKESIKSLILILLMIVKLFFRKVRL